jgi:hypothetical protein
MKRTQGLLTAIIAVLLLLLASNVILAQQVTPDVTPEVTADGTPVDIPTFTDGRINPQAFAPVVLFCSSPAGGRLSGAQVVSGFPAVTGANATPTATGQTNENTVLTVYVLNSAGEGTLAWELDFATGRLFVPLASQRSQTVTPTGTRVQSGSGAAATSTPADGGASATSTPSGSTATATPTQSAAIPGSNSFARQSNVIAQAATPTPTDTTGGITATATQSSAATATPGTSGSGISQTPVATVSGQSGQNVTRSVTLASAYGVALSVSNGRYIISAPQLDGKLYQFVFDGCPNVGDFDVLVNGVPTN